MAILEIRGITKHFGGLTAVNDLSFSVEKGQVLGIVGPNGSGKTTAFNLISGFIKPDRGQVIFEDEEITALKPHVIVKKGMARTFQVVRIFRHLTVYENIRAGKISTIRFGENINQEIDKVLRLVGLEGKEKELALNLPIGDLKRLEIGRALSTNPKVVLLDEPFSGLSHFEVNSIAALLGKLLQEGLTVVIVEHVLRELRRLAQQIIVLDFGVKIAEGAFDEVINQQVVRDAYLGGAARAWNR